MLRPAIVFLFCGLAFAASPRLLDRPWSAQWITAANAPPHDYGVYLFRCDFQLGTKPERYPIHVSGDNRYILFVNGTMLAEGPARGDLFHWRYESLDIASYLKAGENTLAAVVWNDGVYAGLAQISNRTGFLVQGGTEAEAAVNTGEHWRAVQDLAYRAHPIAADQKTGYHAIGPAESFDATKHPWGWQMPGFRDKTWPQIQTLGPGEPRGVRDGKTRWMLVETLLPSQERKPFPPPRVRKTDYPGTLGNIERNTKATFLLDQEELVTGFPQFRFSGGRGARIGIRYAEGLWQKLDPREKGDRNEIDGKRFLGYQDVYLSDGGEGRTYEPLSWRTWRYMEVTVQTSSDPLRIDEMNVTYSAYPFELRSKFSSQPVDLSEILSTGWRTARLCAHETYMDCPYYEQLQYAGDTRIQGLVSIYNSGDTRLLRNAIEQIDDSRTSDGLTFSRAPSAQPQYIPGFSLWWIGMVHDYWMYVDDAAFVKKMLPGVRNVLAWFQLHQKDNQLLGPLPWWNYLDWTASWDAGVPPADPGGVSAAFDMQMALAYRWAADLEQAFGNPAVAQLNRIAQSNLLQSIRRTYYNDARGLFADTAAHSTYSQQANALAVIGGAVSGELAKSVLEKTLQDKTLTQASTYFLAYVNGALKDAGLGDRYLEQLEPWHRMLELHLTTWAENLQRDRSDCHAWGSSPNYEIYRTVLGIESIAPGFKRVRIEPSLGALTEASGTIPHPKGEITVGYRSINGRLEVHVDLPPDTAGEFLWHGKRRELKTGGRSVFTL